jgi:nifR3 family TIM-barrel protein
MTILPKNLNGCPYLLLAPMEGVGDRCFRKAMASVGGFNEGVADFLRVPSNAHVQSLAKAYEAKELAPIPLAVQLMGSDPELMATMAIEVERRGAPRIDLNCGCPSNTVTGRGAGSSLLKDPELLHQIAKAMVKAVTVPVTIKMRSGYEDTSRFKENLFAAQESGICFITLHPRTKIDGYGPPARWDLIAEAKSILKIPLVGNGDILNVEDALKMLKETGCDALMIGRGSVINPFIFHHIQAYFNGKAYRPRWDDLKRYLETYITEIPSDSSPRLKINKMKQLMGFLFKASEELMMRRQAILSTTYTSFNDFLDFSIPFLKEGWEKKMSF